MGKTHCFDLTVEPLRDLLGNVFGVTCAAMDVTPMKRAAADRERLIEELQEALASVKLLSGLLPICAGCKKIRDQHESWQPLEIYISANSEEDFSHGMCPDCLDKFSRTALEPGQVESSQE
jgi:sigma-B regulation protein RsbU (phosphoserine phosphatase)